MNQTTQTVTLPDGTCLAVHTFAPDDTTGTPADLLLVHGFPANGATFAEFADTLQLALAPAVSLRVIAPDLRGYGDSDKPKAGYTCEQFAADVLAIADALGLQDYVLAGHSMGGKIAQLVAALRPANLRGLVLITPGLLSASVPPADLETRLSAHGDATKIRALVSGWVSRPLDDANAMLVTNAGLQVGLDAWNDWLSIMRGEDFAERAAQIAVPTLVIGAGKDTQRTEAELQTSVQNIPNAQYAALPMSGHLPHIEDPVTLAALVVNFWDTLPVEANE